MSHAQSQLRGVKGLASAVSTFLENVVAGYADKRSGFPSPNPDFAGFDFFCTEQVPTISVSRYVDRLAMYMKCSPECFVYAMVYLTRLARLGVPLHDRSIHRLLLTSCVVAAKTRDDLYYSMTYYGQVGGVTARDLCIMEIKLLNFMLKFATEVTVDEYDATLRAMSQLVECSSDPRALDIVYQLIHGADTATAKGISPLPTPHMQGRVASWDTNGVSSGSSPRDEPPSGSTSPWARPLPLLPQAKPTKHYDPNVVIRSQAPRWVLDAGLHWVEE